MIEPRFDRSESEHESHWQAASFNQLPECLIAELTESVSSYRTIVLGAAAKSNGDRSQEYELSQILGRSIGLPNGLMCRLNQPLQQDIRELDCFTLSTKTSRIVG